MKKRCGLSDEFVIHNAIKINNALKSLGAPFYLVCTNANKKKKSQETWRRVGTCTIPGWENSYYSNEQNVVKYLKKNLGISLSELRKNPDKFLKEISDVQDVQEIKEEIKPVENIIVNEIKEAITEVKNSKPTKEKINKKAKEVKKEVEKQLKKTDLPAEAKEIIPEIIEAETKEAITEAIEEKPLAPEIKIKADEIIKEAVEVAANQIETPFIPAIGTEQADRDRRADEAASAIDAFLNLVNSRLSK